MKAIIGLLFCATVAFSDPNADFKQCCQSRGVAETCLDSCAYDIDMHQVYEAFSNGKCNYEKDGEAYIQCTYNNKDMTDCCRKVAGPKLSADQQYCLELCNTSVPVPVDPKFLKCPPIQEAHTQCGKESRS